MSEASSTTTREARLVAALALLAANCWRKHGAEGAEAEDRAADPTATRPPSTSEEERRADTTRPEIIVQHT